MKRLAVILLSIIIMCATIGSVLVFAAPKDGDTNKIIVGALDKASPYSSKSQSDDKQILTYCMDQCFGGEYDIEYKYYSSYSEMLTALGKGKTELLGKVNTGINNISKTELNNKISNIENNTTSNVVLELKGYSIYFKIVFGVFVLLIVFGFIYILNLKARRDVAKDRLLKQNQLLREAKIKQEQFTELSRKRREELERLEREISEKIADQQEEADKLKEQSENLQQKNEEMKSQTDLLETMLLDKYVQVEDYHKQLEEYEERLERYLMVENYQKRMEQDVRDRIDMLGYSKMHLEEVDLKMSLRDIIPDIKALAETANVDFSLEIDEMKTPVVACDLKKLNEMVIGLVFTAMRSTEEYGKVELGIHQVGDDGAFAFFDYTCVFTGDTIDYSGNAITNLGGVLKIQRNEEGKTLMEVSVRFPLIDVLVDAVGEDILRNEEENDEEQAYIDDDDIMDGKIESSEAEELME